MNIFKKIKRLYYRLRNSDPVKNCPVYREQGCSHVDGLLCFFPDCDIVHEYMGHEWIGCGGCTLNEQCCRKQYGLGCYDGERIKNDQV